MSQLSRSRAGAAAKAIHRYIPWIGKQAINTPSQRKPRPTDKDSHTSLKKAYRTQKWKALRSLIFKIKNARDNETGALADFD